MYQKNNWAKYDPSKTPEQQPDAFITLTKLNNIEKGIEDASKECDNTKTLTGVLEGTELVLKAKDNTEVCRVNLQPLLNTIVDANNIQY